MLNITFIRESYSCIQMSPIISEVTKKDKRMSMNLFTSAFEASASYFYGREYKELSLGKFVFSPISVNFIEFEDRK